MSNPEGVARRCQRPNEEFVPAWTAIKLAEGVHERLLAQALLSFTVRQKLPFEAAPLHSLIVLAGPPGTGKTTLGRGLANRVAKRFPYTKSIYVEVDPHVLTNSALGRSQQAVAKLFEQTIPELAMNGVAIVLLDEVEALAIDRYQLSLQANPIDVHRKIEPRPDIRGDIARTSFYMDAAYPGCGIVSENNQKLCEAWDKEDPVDDWERGCPQPQP